VPPVKALLPSKSPPLLLSPQIALMSPLYLISGNT
jgi:hypothetical protein